MPASTRVATDAGDVLPIAVIARDVVIDEVHLEEGRAVTPVETEFVHEATRRDLPAAVAHPARLHQLAHQRVDQRVIGVARAPAREGPQLEAARRAATPAMLTLDARVVRQDCLCYLMERLPLPRHEKAARELCASL